MLPAALLLASLAPAAQAWTVPAYMNLASPPRWTTDVGDQYLVKDGAIQKGFETAAQSCMHQPVPANVSRSYFPITGGALRFDFVNTSTASTGDAFLIDMYFQDSPMGANRHFQPGSLKRMQWWRGFADGMSCSVPLDLTLRLRDRKSREAVEGLEGLNVTFALQIQDYRNNTGLFEQVDQCAYVTLTSDKSLLSNTTLSNTTVSSRELTEEEMCGRVDHDKLASEPSGTVTAEGAPSATATTESWAIRQHVAQHPLLYALPAVLACLVL